MQLLIGCLNSSSNRISEIDPTVSASADTDSAFFLIFFLNLESNCASGANNMIKKKIKNYDNPVRHVTAMFGG